MLPISKLAIQRKKRARQRRTTFLLFYLRNLVVMEQYNSELVDKEDLKKLLEEIYHFFMEDEKFLQEAIDNQRKDAGKDGPLMRPQDWDILIEAGFINPDDERA